MDLFRSRYTVRRFYPQNIVSGYAAANYEDFIVKLNVQPLNPYDLESLSEGERTIKRVKAFGDLPLRSADQETGMPGDWIYYLGQWYKCTSSVLWNHTILEHYRSEFTAIAESIDGPETRPPHEGRCLQ